MLCWTDWEEVVEKKLDPYFSLMHLLYEGENCVRFVSEEKHLSSKI